MKFFQRNPVAVFGVVLAWRVLLLVFTAQPIPANDAFGYDGPVVNLLHGGRYCNPSMAIIFPIAGTEVFAMYPPLYEGVLLAWMKLLGTSVIAAMALHLTLPGKSGVCFWSCRLVADGAAGFSGTFFRGGGGRTDVGIVADALHVGHRGRVFFWRVFFDVRYDVAVAAKTLLVRAVCRRCCIVCGDHALHRKI